MHRVDHVDLPDAGDITDAPLPSGSPAGAGLTFLLGSDGQGQDMLSGILYRLRISLVVGLGSAAFAAVVGAAIGLVAAYAGGRATGRSCGWWTCSSPFPRSWWR